MHVDPLTTAARVVLWCAIGAFSLVGASGALFGAWEFRGLYPLPLDELGPDHVTLMNQLRFLKALELAVGVLLFSVRSRALRDPIVNRAFIITLLVSPLARLISCWVDGWPHWNFVALMAVELTGAVIVILHSVLVVHAGDSKATGSS